jgi:hypothetical protein
MILANNPSSLVIVHLGHRIGLLGCGWQLVLEIEDLLEEVGDLLLLHLEAQCPTAQQRAPGAQSCGSWCQSPLAERECDSALARPHSSSGTHTAAPSPCQGH